MRFFLELAYDGTAYHGWQIQKNAITVQQVLNEAMSTILRKEIATIGSGRTDTGVHARKQIVHFDLDSQPSDDFCHRLNNFLPKDISICSLRRVNDDAHARFNAVSRSYVYRMSKKKSPFEVNKSYHYGRGINTEILKKCSEALLNWTDFECFSKVHTDVNSFDCKIFESRWEETNEHLIFYVSANRFLRGMVRAIVGTLLMMSEKRLDLADFLNILKSKDRKQAGRSVPAHGLYLSEVSYPKEVYI